MQRVQRDCAARISQLPCALHRSRPNNQDGDGCTDSPTKIRVCGQCGTLSDSSYATGGYLP